MSLRYYTAVLIFLTAGLAAAQQGPDGADPFHGNYTLGGRADIAVFNGRAAAGFDIGYAAFRRDSALHPVMFDQGASRILSSDCAAGQFMLTSATDQARDEAVFGSLESVGDSLILVKLTVGQFDGGSWSAVPVVIDSLKKKASTVTQRMSLRMTEGYFNTLPQKSFMVAYNLPADDQKITIRMFRLDSLTAQPVEMTSVRSDTLPASAGAQAFFDVTAADFDLDGLDEILCLKTTGPMTIAGANGVIPVNIHAYDYDWNTGSLAARGILNSSLGVPVSIGLSAALEQLVLTSGEFDGDGTAEAVAGYMVNYSSLVSTPVVHCIQPFRVNPNLMTYSLNPANMLQLGSFSSDAVMGSSLFRTGPLSLASADLDRDGYDEVICAGMRDIQICRLDAALRPTIKTTLPSFSKYDYNGRRRIAIADVNGDTTFADSSHARWLPEIVTSEFSVDPRVSGTGGSSNYHRIRVYRLTDSASLAYAMSSDLVQNYPGAPPPDLMNNGGIVPAFLDGNAIRLGRPRKVTVRNLVEPVIILNAPPIHFDVIGDSVYDVCSSYPIDPGTGTNFLSQYTKSGSTEAELTTTVHSDWGVSATLSMDESFFGIGVKASISAKYGEAFSKTSRRDSTMTVTISQSTTWDDKVFATITDYDLYEYPVYALGVKRGNILAAMARVREPRWFQVNDRKYGNGIILPHEPGNLLSYPNYSPLSTNPDIAQLIAKGPYIGIDVASSDKVSWGLNWQTIDQQSAERSRDYGFSASGSVEGWGVSLEVEGQYNQGEINTHSTTVTQNIDMLAQFGTLNSAYSSAGYSILPYAYWSVNGPLVLDYLVDLTTGGVGGSFWEDHYSQKPDLTFNCYFRYFGQKGMNYEPSMSSWTKEILISPATPRPGDTVTVTAKFHNYSLKSTTGPVNVRFYVGSSQSSGSVVTSVDGDTAFATSSPVPARGDQMIRFTWRVPTGLTASDTMLYAVIDPDNQVDEIRKDNNIGWMRLVTTAGPTGIMPRYAPPAVYGLDQNYPNPFNPVTRIRYNIPVGSHVTLTVFNLLGQVVKTLTDRTEIPGQHEIAWDASGVASGVYFYRLDAVSVDHPATVYTAVKKMLLLH